MSTNGGTVGRTGRESGFESIQNPDSPPARFHRGVNRAQIRLGDPQHRGDGMAYQSGPDRPTVWKILRVIATFFVAIIAGWFAAQGIVLLVGKPPALVQYLLAIILSILISGVVAIVLTKITGRPPGNPQIGQELMAALDRISRGDFSVRLAPYGDGPLTELAESVNSMAAGLGTMEQKRQEFISNVSHEIQSPLTSINGFASLLRDGGLDPATHRHYVDVIISESKRLSQLSDNLLRLSALDDEVVLTTTPYRLDEQLRDVVVMLEPQWSAKHICVEVNAEPINIEADKQMLSMVWINLINNAIKYSTGGHDELVRCVEGEVGGGGRITVLLDQALEAGVQMARCVISDEGIGIAQCDLPRIFERFYRADKARSGEGNGLGLALVARIVEVHSGRIDVSSEVGVGTSMTVLLPIHEIQTA